MGIYCTAAQALDGCKSSTNVPALIISGRVSTGFNWLGCLDMSFLMMSLWFKEVTTSTLNEDKWSINLQVGQTINTRPVWIHILFSSQAPVMLPATRVRNLHVLRWSVEKGRHFHSNWQLSLPCVILMILPYWLVQKGFRTMDVTNMKTYQYLCRVLLLHACANVYIRKKKHIYMYMIYVCRSRQEPGNTRGI